MYQSKHYSVHSWSTALQFSSLRYKYILQFDHLGVIQLEVGSVVNLIVIKSDVILESLVPLFEDDFFGSSTDLSSQELLKVPDCVFGHALDPDFFADTVLADI